MTRPTAPTRTEHDLLGDREVPAGAYYGVHTLRAVENFPITGTVLILNAVHIWNDFFTPLLYLGGSGRETVPVRVFAFVNEYTSDYGLVAAGLVLAALPILLVTSWVLFDRLALGSKTKTFRNRPGEDGPSDGRLA